MLVLLFLLTHLRLYLFYITAVFLHYFLLHFFLDLYHFLGLFQLLRQQLVLGVYVIESVSVAHKRLFAEVSRVAQLACVVGVNDLAFGVNDLAFGVDDLAFVAEPFLLKLKDLGLELHNSLVGVPPFLVKLCVFELGEVGELVTALLEFLLNFFILVLPFDQQLAIVVELAIDFNDPGVEI